MFYKLLFLFIFLLSCQDQGVFPVREEIGKPEFDTESMNTKYPNRFLISDRIQQKINRYESIVKKYAKRYGFDWRLIMAQIRQESHYNEKASSRVGAKGLMQIMPETANELGSELDIEYIYRNPRENIAAGVFHLYKQYSKLGDVKDKKDRLDMALAAYNAGFGRVMDARDIAAVVYNNDQKWDLVAKAITKLNRKDWQIHLQVWPDGIPPHGYFNGSLETVGYVNSINSFYDTYKKFY